MEITKILTVVYSLGKGGTERAAQNFAESYLNLGIDSRVLYTLEGGMRTKKLESSGVKVYNFLNKLHMAELSEWQPDVIHLHSSNLTLALVQDLKNVFRPHYIWETSVFSVPSDWEHLIDKSFQLSSWCQWLYLRRGGSLAKACVVPYPVNISCIHRITPECIANRRSCLGYSKDEIILGRVGQAHEFKWSPHLITAFEKLRDSNNQLRLLLVNTHSTMVERANISRYLDDIKILGPVHSDAELREIYSLIDIFAHLAYQGESFGMVLAESLLCETPVVTLATPWADNSQAEVIGNGRGGLVAANLKEFEVYISCLVSNPKLREQLGKQGKKYIAKTYESRLIARTAIFSGQHHSVESFASGGGKIPYYSSRRPSILVKLLLRAGMINYISYASGCTPWSQLAVSFTRRVTNRFRCNSLKS